MRRWLVLLAMCGACAGSQPSAAANGRPRCEPAPLLPVSAFTHDVQWRQRVTAAWPSGSHGFDAVLQKQNGELLLLGLSPLGLPGFVLRLHENGSIDVENRSGRELPFEPRYVMADVERVFFPWLPEPPPSAGERQGEVKGMHVRERYEHGQLVARSFERQTRAGLERVEISYSGWQAGQDAPAHATLHNLALGYRLTIDTLEQARLAP
jgi:hypothetical protein